VLYGPAGEYMGTVALRAMLGPVRAKETSLHLKVQMLTRCLGNAYPVGHGMRALGLLGYP